MYLWNMRKQQMKERLAVSLSFLTLERRREAGRKRCFQMVTGRRQQPKTSFAESLMSTIT